MSDDLVELSEPMTLMRTKDVKHLLDRIEELEAKLATCEKYRDAYAEMGRIGTEAYRDLEAKLAKAVEALEEIATDEHPLGWIAIAALAELKGEK